MCRRGLVIAGTLLFLWISPAAAQDYGRILSEDQGRVTTVDVDDAPLADRATGGLARTGSNEDAPLADRATGGLARTGSNEIVPMAQAAIVLLGGGSLLLLVARRRAAQGRRQNLQADRSGA